MLIRNLGIIGKDYWFGENRKVSRPNTDCKQTVVILQIEVFGTGSTLRIRQVAYMLTSKGATFERCSLVIRVTVGVDLFKVNYIRAPISFCPIYLFFLRERVHLYVALLPCCFDVFEKYASLPSLRRPVF